MIELQNIGINFQGTWLFENLSWNIGDDDRIGLIGANGTGKTTILRIIAGQVESDKGIVLRSKKCNIGYLPQENITFSGRTLLDEMKSVFESAKSLFDTKHSIEARFGEVSPESEEFQELLEKHGEIEEEIQRIDGYTLENRAEKILSGLGFDRNVWGNLTETFSGGWEMRIALGKLLLQNPDYLLLDEPTNFLDIESIIWLENYLKSFQGGIVIVSHDRYFMDRLVKRVAEIELGQLIRYRTNYSGYLKEKEKRRGLTLKAYKEQQEEIVRLKAFIAKNKANKKKARLVRSREKILDKMELISAPALPKRARFVFSPAPRSGDKVMELKAIGMKYSKNTVFEDIDLTVRRGERVAVVGVNGMGKTTLAKILAGVLEPTWGERRLGANVEIGYFAQKTLEMLNRDNSVLSELETIAPAETETRLRTFLGAFLFSGDDAFKQVKVLSGGEKTRLAIAKILINPVNLLILDEPTNHLDLTGREVLAEALKAYSDTIILVTHDRSVIDAVATKVIEMDKGVMEVYSGNYTDYVMAKTGAIEKEKDASDDLRKGDADPESRSHTQTLRSARSSRTRKNRKRKGDADSKMSEMEKLIEEKEQRVSELEKSFMDPGTYSDKEKIKSLTVEHKSLKKEIKALYEQWERGED
jgi:ATP-binding cassette subfamily F protein 3